ncbi:sigma-54 interaction domain-containing protein [Alkaliphilus transvaalensis]|uniref:sigma-54 interaction domain-containing protein n=1 Tax=Alkaliphilus transvaalensis TaxID=114628 RepID=UPI00047E1855|nr:sigma 54-interacting transcriptional regulator [Alkaliphilus transvaalensis]
MIYNEETTRQFTDMMTEGFIFIDAEGKIQIYNNRAKEIFGITYNQGVGHETGQITPGDIIIIGDNSIGMDDGGLTPADLKVMGINDENIQLGDSILAIGVIGKKEMPPLYIYRNPKEVEDELLKLETVYCNENISIVLNYHKKFINIVVNGKEVKMKYRKAIGHMVVLDQYTHQIKFYQAKGYTARGEGLKELLRGKVYRGKGKGVEDFNVIGRSIFDIHSNSSNTVEFFEAARDGNISYKNEYREINGRATICTLNPIIINNKPSGAVLKVEDISEIRKVIKERDEALLHLERLEHQLREEETIYAKFPDILGDSPEINRVKKLAYRASKTNSTVVLLGESGTGKSLLAKAIHEVGKTKNTPFVHVNCGSIPENLLESELFGYEGGAFTGAKREGKPGMFELAQGGTLFLDEIGELTPLIQVKLLQALQSKSFYRIGGSKSITVDVRIIVATNKNLEDEVAKGNFREDLYYRINVFPIIIPPLRQRKQDINIITDQTLSKVLRRIGWEEKRISIEARNLLYQYDWPGNVRELENIIERAINLAEGNLICSRHLTISQGTITNKNEVETVMPLKEVVMAAEKRALEEALVLFSGDKVKAMKALKIGKTSFYEKYKKYHIGSS